MPSSVKSLNLRPYIARDKLRRPIWSHTALREFCARVFDVTIEPASQSKQWRSFLPQDRTPRLADALFRYTLISTYNHRAMLCRVSLDK